MPDKMISPGISNRRLQVRPCITCGGKRDIEVAYITRQGKRSRRMNPRCRECCAERRRLRYEKTGDSGKAWKDRNREAISAYNKRRQADPDVRALKAYHQRLRKARMRSGQGDDEAIRAVYRMAKQIEKTVASCPVFSLPELGYEMQVDHIVPLSKGGKHEASNLQILPVGLNMRKGAKLPCRR